MGSPMCCSCRTRRTTDCSLIWQRKLWRSSLSGTRRPGTLPSEPWVSSTTGSKRQVGSVTYPDIGDSSYRGRTRMLQTCRVAHTGVDHRRGLAAFFFFFFPPSVCKQEVAVFFLSNLRSDSRRKLRKRPRLLWRCRTWWSTVSHAAKRRTASVNTCRLSHSTCFQHDQVWDQIERPRTLSWWIPKQIAKCIVSRSNIKKYDDIVSFINCCPCCPCCPLIPLQSGEVSP